MDVNNTILNAWEDKTKKHIAKTFGDLPSAVEYAYLYGRLRGFVLYSLDEKTTEKLFAMMNEECQ